jgi:hypothetical protein
VVGWGGSPELKNDVSAARCPAHARATKTLHHFEIAPAPPFVVGATSDRERRIRKQN